MVDLFTFDRELEDIMLAEYPGVIFPEQHRVDDSEPEARVYWFYGLEEIELLKFLSKYRAGREFEIRGEDGKLIEANKPGKSHGVSNN